MVLNMNSGFLEFWVDQLKEMCVDGEKNMLNLSWREFSFCKGCEQ